MKQKPNFLTKYKLLIVHSTQFGYHTDTLMYCKYLDKSIFEIHYFGFDHGLDKFQLEDVNVHYIVYQKNKLILYFKYIAALIKVNRQNHFDLIFHVHTKLSLIIRFIFLFNKYIFDIRTGDLDDNLWKRQIKNFFISIISKLSVNKSVIADSLADELHINKKKRHIIPLGAESLCEIKKEFQVLHLIYVGTLTKRNIHETITGVALFLKKYKDVEILYDIIGAGNRNYEAKLIESINDNSLNKKVHFHGFVKYSELKPFFEKANVGITYIPQKKYYQNQPSTKLFEYLLAGMPVIATNTYENRKIVNDNCGFICEDNAHDFSIALEKLYTMRMTYNSDFIKKQFIKSNWNNIVKEYVEPFFIDKITQ